MDTKLADQENPGLSKIVGRNIRTIIELRQQAARQQTREDRAADAITGFSGSMLFVYLHCGWFALWVVLNTGWFGLKPFDPFPYGLLTMVVSLEAIFLSTLVLITQNRLTAEAEHRADLDLHVGLLAEHELTRVLVMLEAIHKKLHIAEEASNELQDLEMETRPEDVLAEIARLQRSATTADGQAVGGTPAEEPPCGLAGAPPCGLASGSDESDRAARAAHQ